GYERRLRPNINGVPVVVTCSMIIKRFGPVQETSMDYQTSIILQMRWNDPRLQNIFTPTSKNSYDLGNNYIDSIWKPCLFFENEKMASAHAIIAVPAFGIIYKNTKEHDTFKLTMSLECTMTLNDYPMDSQKCHMNLESYGYTTNDVILQWNDTNPIVFNTSHIVTTFTVYEDGKLGNCTQTYGTGTFSCISLEITLSRDIGYNLIQIYIPSMLLVIISWFSFWIDMSAAPARAGLGITTILTITTQSSAANAQLPKVSYIKAIDVWMGMCQVFAFAALLEFAAVNVMARQNKRAMKELKKKSDGSKEMVCISFYVFLNTSQEKSQISYRFSACLPRESKLLNHVQLFSFSGCTKTPDEQELKNTFVTQAHTIDRISRIVFPTTFLILNIFYWVFYKVV
uniref:Glycine receptor, alpha 4a n=1 Tax=Petromyzon marinus TaxID=7757 RepID=S4RKZ2_PETMA